MRYLYLNLKSAASVLAAALALLALHTRSYLIALVAALAACDSPTEPLHDPRGLLLVVPGQGPAAEIFVMRPDASERRRLTDNAVLDADPAWSPYERAEEPGALRVLASRREVRGTEQRLRQRLASPAVLPIAQRC